MQFQSSDNIKSVGSKIGTSFIIHLATKHKFVFVTYSNRFWASLISIFAIFLFGYAKKKLSVVKNPDLKLLIYWLFNVMEFLELLSSFIFAVTLDYLFTDAVSGNEFTFESIFKPTLSMLIIAAVTAFLQYVEESNKEDPKEAKE